MNIIWKGSPNFSKRTKKVTKIIIHWFGVGTIESANTRFQNQINKVSAHYGISKGRIWQWVDEKNVAFHAGNFGINQESIGIEHDATLNDHNLSEIDYELSGQLVREISQRHGIPLDRKHILGHREVKATSCPGTIDIDRIIAIAKGSHFNQLIKDSMLVKEKGKSDVFALVSGVLIAFLDWASLRKDFPDEPIIELDSSEIKKLKKASFNQITKK